MGIGLAALAGVPPLIGFFTKDTVIDAALEGATGGGGPRAWIVVVALFVTVVLTAAYCTRAWLLLDTPVAATGQLPDPQPAVVTEEDVAVVTTTDSADDAEVERVHAHGHAGHHAVGGARRVRASPRSPSSAPSSSRASAVACTSGCSAPCCPSCSSPAPRMPCGPSATAAGSTSPTGSRAASGSRRCAASASTRHTSASVGRSPRSRVSSSRSTVTSSTPTRARRPSSRAPPVGRGSASHRAVPSLSLLSLLVGVVVVAVLGVAAWR